MKSPLPTNTKNEILKIVQEHCCFCDASGFKYKLSCEDDIKDQTEQIMKIVASKLQEVEITERAKHRDAGCRCGLCKQDIINMQISAQLKGEQNE